MIVKVLSLAKQAVSYNQQGKQIKISSEPGSLKPILAGQIV